MNLQTSHLNLEKLLPCIEDGIFVIDAQRRIVMFSPACERLTGFSASEVMGSSCQCSDLVACQDQLGRSLAGCLCPGYLVFRGERPVARQRMRITTKSGAYRWVETTYAPVPGDDGRSAGIVGVMRDVSDAVEREREMREKIDALSHDPGASVTHPGDNGTGTEGDPNSAGKLDDKLAEVERQAILTALRNARGQRSLAAKTMGISRSRLYRRMEALGIAPGQRGL